MCVLLLQLAYYMDNVSNFFFPDLQSLGSSLNHVLPINIRRRESHVKAFNSFGKCHSLITILKEEGEKTLSNLCKSVSSIIAFYAYVV